VKLATAKRTLGIGFSHQQGVNEETLLKDINRILLVQKEEERKKLQRVQAKKQPEEIVVKDQTGNYKAEIVGTPALLEVEQPKEAVQATAGAGRRHQK